MSWVVVPILFLACEGGSSSDTNSSEGSGGTGAASGGASGGASDGASGGGRASTGGFGGSGGSDSLGGMGGDTTRGGSGTGGEPEPVCPTDDVMPETCDDAETCNEGEECIAGVCIPACDQDLSALGDALGDRFEPLAAFCGIRARNAYAHPVVVDDCKRWAFFGMGTSGQVGSNVVNWVLRRHELNPPDVAIVRTERGFGDYFPTWDGVSFWDSGALSPDASRLVFSINGDSFGGAQVLSVPTQGNTIEEGPSMRVMGMSFLDNDTVLMAGGYGQDVFALDAPYTDSTPPVVLTGFDSGPIAIEALRELGFVLVLDGTNALYALPIARIQEVLEESATPIDVSNDPDVQIFAGAGDMQALGNDYLLTWSDVFKSDRVLQTLRVEDDVLVLGEPEPFERSDLIEHIVYLEDGIVSLNHFGGSIVGRLAP